MPQKKVIPPPEYQAVLSRTIRSISSIVDELESEILYHPTMRASHHEWVMDVVPLVKKLTDARRYAEGAMPH